MSFSESEIQAYIWSVREHFANLLENENCLDDVAFKADLSDLTPMGLLHNRTLARIREAYHKLFSIELIGVEVPLEQKSNSTIRADFLATFPGNTGIGIIELKKSAQTERQAFTELLAYSNHLATVFPALTREDVVYILIAPFETRICRDALIQSLIFDNRVVVGLIPILSNPGSLPSLKLRLWVPRKEELWELAHIAFREENFSVCKVVWEYSEGWWDAEPGKSPSDALASQLNSVSAIAAQAMEAAGIHGFAYTSQTWSELSSVLPFTNALILVGLNPYAVGGAQFLMRSYPEHQYEIPAPQSFLPNLTDIIPGLASGAEPMDKDFDYLSDLYSVWDSQLFRIGKSVVDAATQTTSGQSLRTDQGFFDWATYQRQFLEDTSCTNFSVRPTGLIRDLFMTVTRMDYALAGQVGVENHPVHGDMYFNAIETLISQVFFRKFILRMLGDGSIDD